MHPSHVFPVIVNFLYNPTHRLFYNSEFSKFCKTLRYAECTSVCKMNQLQVENEKFVIKNTFATCHFINLSGKKSFEVSLHSRRSSSIGRFPVEVQCKTGVTDLMIAHFLLYANAVI
jgi:hypothetical protein